MTVRTRAAETPDVPLIVDLLIEDATQRQASNPALWAVDGAAREKAADALISAIEADEQPFRQKWLVAEAGEELVAVAHSMMLPVPPIYAGSWGAPGLLLEDCALGTKAPPGTADALLDAAESDLRAAGARLLLASSVPGGPWQAAYARRGYESITLYLSKPLDGGAACPGEIRAAAEADIPQIVARSARNRQTLAALDEFWTSHPEADARFGGWMKRSLTLGDRDMLLAGPAGAVDGYVIAQPASRLHFPPAHDVASTGVIDDYFHADFADPSTLRNGGKGAATLLRAAEAAFAARGVGVALAVCPAAWTSKVSVLESEGYETAMIWMIRRPAD